VRYVQVDIKTIEEFADYTGPAFSYDEGLRYFEDRFLRLKKTEDKGTHVPLAGYLWLIQCVQRYSCT
jgi:hypothetical protein